MAEDKDLQKQIQKGLNDVNQATKEGVATVKQQAKDTSATIKQQAKDTIADVKEKANDIIADVKEKAKDVADKATEKIVKAKDKAVEKLDDVSSKSVDKINNISEKQQDKIEKTTEKQKSEFEKTAKGAVETFKKLAEQQATKLGEKVSNTPQATSKDITTTILQNILTEIKVLRKVTEGRVSFDSKSGRYRGAGGRYVKEKDVREDGDAVQEKSEREEKRKGFFTSIKEKFAKGKDAVSKKTAPLREGYRDIKEGSKDFFSNPLVLAGLLALIAPKEILAFLKGFLGELLFGENANGFVQGLAAFIAVWQGMKFVKAISGFIRLVKGIFTIARFLFMNPMLLLAIALIASAVTFIQAFKKKQAQRAELSKKEEELKILEDQLKTSSDAGQRKLIEGQINEKKKEIAELNKQGVYKSPAAGRQATIGAMAAMPGGMELAGLRAVEFGIAAEKIKNGEALSKDEQGTFESYKNEKDPFLSILRDFGPKNPSPDEVNTFKENVQKNIDVARGRTPKLEKAASTTSYNENSQTDTGPAPQSTTPQTTTGTAPSSTVATQAGELQKKQEEVARLEESVPSTGQDINDTSEAVDAGYEQTPEDSITTVSADTSTIPKPANVINSVPGIFADRSAISEFELFGTPSVFPSAG